MGDSSNSFMNTLEARLNENMKRAYWDMMEKDIGNNDFRTAFAILEEIRARICLLVPNRVDLHQEIAESLDIDYFKQIQSHNALTIEIVQKITSKYIKNEPLTVILPTFFKEALHRIEKLEYEIKMFKESDIYKILTERNNT